MVEALVLVKVPKDEVYTHASKATILCTAVLVVTIGVISTLKVLLASSITTSTFWTQKYYRYIIICSFRYEIKLICS